MRLLFITIFTLVVVLLSISCKKEVIREVVKNNQHLDDTLVAPIKIESYINKVYISVLGRKANSEEFEKGRITLRQHNLSMQDKVRFLDQVFNQPEYFARVYDIARANYLKNAEESDIDQYLFVFNDYIEKNKNDPNLKDYLYLLEKEISRLKLLKTIPVDIKSEKIDIVEMHRRCADNYFYDQINMGSQNFVLSVFENFSSRYPTDSELENSVKMINGLSGNLFLKSGSSKNDFLNIYFGSKDYCEGQVVELMRRYLFRSPTSLEMGELTTQFLNTKNYRLLQYKILTKDEYIGL